MVKFIAALLILPVFAASALAENKNEIPLYGDAPKTAEERAADERFVQEALAAAGGSKEKAVDHLITSGKDSLRKGESINAIKRFNQAYLLDPNDYRAYWGLGIGMGQQGKFQEAIELIKKAEAINNKDPRLLADHGFALVSEVVLGGKRDRDFLIKNFSEADGLYRRAIEVAPKDPLPYSRLAVLMMYKGDLKQSRELVEKCKALGGDGLDPNFLNDLTKAEAGALQAAERK